ncbi:DUF2977 domain-containing protein [Staphylococcus sp. 18_1_E_LY]|uniref:DUF2977 domain-containing protein n=1 Tax=Staphylococcus lloydii TaxID=2781774 RepID=A0A7T1AZJ2_9STAP|nr:DUF2977 domain-containing protein [Staphylococcus lloydii]MBF7019615.1 DUF2977 domain-containing protein [Staphylococcus lloydii]MBF7027343.1 DUF2977 domain-containing protein [Staphylococcus lloydii]MDU9419023.1 DUF2977 domain-containing protein [Staphylococcus lloydii]QPM75007.1 DUF2977 domain-containing protein [Staphylococcus lloydii]
MWHKRTTANINVNEDKEITSYATVGGVGGIDVPLDILPDDFRENFASKFYLYEDGVIKRNPDYTQTRFDEEEQ